jgi:hypothetical protein
MLQIMTTDATRPDPLWLAAIFDQRKGVIARKLTRKIRRRTSGYCSTVISTWRLRGQEPHAPWRDPARRVGAASEPAAGPARIPGKRQ